MSSQKVLPYNVALLHTDSARMTQKARWKELREAINTTLQSNLSIQETSIRLFRLNILRGRGLLIRSLMEQQMRHPDYTKRYAAIAAVINSKFGEFGKRLAEQLALQFRKSYIRNKRDICLTSATFISCLVDQQVINEVMVLQMLQLLLEKPSDAGIEVVYQILKSSGRYLKEHAETAMVLIFDKLRDIARGDEITSNKAHNMMRTLERWNRIGFERTPREFEVVPDDEKLTHLVELTQNIIPESSIFEYDGKFEENERKYDELRISILGEDAQEKVSTAAKEPTEDTPAPREVIVDATEKNTLENQKKVYLNIMSSMSADEAVHKLVKLSLDSKDKESNNSLIVDMVIKCCSQEKTYSKFFGNIGEKMCLLNKTWPIVYTNLFKSYYEKIDKLENNAIRNLGKFFGHLFAAQVMDISRAWSDIVLTENDTTAASRIFVKFIFQEMIEEEGTEHVKQMVRKAYGNINGMFPVTNVDWQDADHIRFSINYFTAIGLGILTDDMRNVLRDLPEIRGRSIDREDRSRDSSFSRSPSEGRSQ